MSQSALRRGLEQSSDPNHQTTCIMYHGTSMDNALSIKREGFNPSTRGMLGRGVYVTSSMEKACAYPVHLRGQKRAILRLRVQLGRVMKIDRQDHPLQKSWHEASYDSAWVPPQCGMVSSGLPENCVWDPKRIQVLEIIEKDSSSEMCCDECKLLAKQRSLLTVC